MLKLASDYPMFDILDEFDDEGQLDYNQQERSMVAKLLTSPP